MARKTVKKAVKRTAPKKQYAVMWKNEDAIISPLGEFLDGVHDSIQKAKDKAEESYDMGDQYFIYEVKLVAQSERIGKLNWKSK